MTIESIDVVVEGLQMTMMRANSDSRKITTIEDLKNALSRKDQSTLHLVLGQESNLKALTEAIRTVGSTSSNTIQQLKIEVEQDHGVNDEEKFLPCVSEPDWETEVAVELFEALGSLDDIKVIHLESLGTTLGAEGPRFPLELLSLLLDNPNRREILEGLHLKSCSFSCFEDETAMEFGEAIQNLTDLQSIDWEERLFEEDAEFFTAQTFYFPSVTNAIFGLPSLRWLGIRAVGAGKNGIMGLLEDDTLGALCQSQNLERLCLLNFEYTETSIAAMSEALKEPSCKINTLRLDLSFSLASDGLVFCQSLPINQSIKTLELWISYSNNWNKERCLYELADALKENNTLSIVRLHSHDQSLQDSEDTDNKEKKFGDDKAEAFVRMLESNVRITSLGLDDYNLYFTDDQGTYAPLIEFYTDLNTLGRNEIMTKHESLSIDAWMCLLNKTTNRLQAKADLYAVEAMYFWLRQNPAICDVYRYTAS